MLYCTYIPSRDLLSLLQFEVKDFSYSEALFYAVLRINDAGQ